MDQGRTKGRLAATPPVVGCSRMIASNEQRRSRPSAPTAKRCSTRRLPSIAAASPAIGGGTPVEFASVVDALRCAPAIQMRSGARQSAEGPAIVRSGRGLRHFGH
jgi:hypothetical protein